MKATAVSARLRILFVTLQNTNKLSGAVPGNDSYIIRGLSHPRIFFPFLSFYLYPRYPWSSYPFPSSLPQWASSLSHHHLPHLTLGAAILYSHGSEATLLWRSS